MREERAASSDCYMPAVVRATVGVVHFQCSAVGPGQIVARQVNETAKYMEHSGQMEKQKYHCVGLRFRFFSFFFFSSNAPQRVTFRFFGF